MKQWKEFFSKCQSAQHKLKKFLGSSEVSDNSTKNLQIILDVNEKSTGAAASELADSPYLAVSQLESINGQETSCDQDVITLKEVMVASSSETYSTASLPAPVLTQDAQVESEISVLSSVSILKSSASETQKTKKKREKKINRKDSEETEEENGSGSSSRVAKVILTFEQVVERIGRSLQDDETSSVRSWIETKNNRQIFKFIYGCGDDRLWSCHICQQQVRGRYTVCNL